VTQKIKFHILAVYLFLANLADAFLTHRSVSSGEAEELNPLMAHLLELGPLYFFFVKTMLVLLGIVLLAKSKNRKWSYCALAICSVAYTLILFVHAKII
tara:strand:+ start:42 stop:338 length:297 start_codon:yes stop_codon:yes gene_type:complete